MPRALADFNSVTAVWEPGESSERPQYAQSARSTEFSRPQPGQIMPRKLTVRVTA